MPICVRIQIPDLETLSGGDLSQAGNHSGAPYDDAKTLRVLLRFESVIRACAERLTIASGGVRSPLDDLEHEVAKKQGTPP